jgi:hypothetical protein
MKRLDVVFALTLTSLASFVAIEAYTMRAARASRHLVGAAGSNAEHLVAPVAPVRMASSAGVALPSSLVRAPRPAPRDDDANPESAARRIAASSPGTYIGEVLASHDSSIARWPDRRLQPLRVWVQPVGRIHDWNPASVDIVRNAFMDWAGTGIPINFSFVLDSASADVRVSWIDRFTEPISGKTLWSHDDRWLILEASIILAVHHRTGETLDSAATRAIALHEIGHLIGLDHTNDSTSIMTPRVRVKNLSAADVATAQLLYTLPPGRVGTP